MQSDQRLILYPRSYNRRGAEHLHSIRGVTRDGTPVNIKLRDVAPGAPTVNELARTDRGAPSPCTAHPDNGPTNRHGILLFSRIEQEEVDPDGTVTYRASAVDVLAEDERSAEPMIGFGRVEIKDGGPGKRTAFHAIHYQREAMATFEIGQRDHIIKSLAELLESNTKHGMVGGLLVRPLDRDGYPLPYAQPEHFRRFVPSQQIYQPGADVVTRLLERLPPGTHKLQVMPAIKVHSAKVAETHYSDPEQMAPLKALFEPASGGRPICNLAIRVTYFKDSDMTLLYRFYVLSPAIGLASDDSIWSSSPRSESVEVFDPLLRNAPLLRTPWADALKLDGSNIEPVFQAPSRPLMTPSPAPTTTPTDSPTPVEDLDPATPATSAEDFNQAKSDAAIPHQDAVAPPVMPATLDAPAPAPQPVASPTPVEQTKPQRGLNAFLSRRKEGTPK